jgi:diguanylate cyclase (GGDEF)-like protein
MLLQEAQVKAEDMRQKLQSIVVEKEGHKITTTVSIGIAIFPQHGDSIKELINQADQAMYVAKEKGRNQVMVASMINAKNSVD